MTNLLLASGLMLLGLGVLWRHNDVLNMLIKVSLVLVGVLDIVQWVTK